MKLTFENGYLQVTGVSTVVLVTVLAFLLSLCFIGVQKRAKRDLLYVKRDVLGGCN